LTLSEICGTAGLCQTVPGTPAHFVWNMDEMGHQAWSDARDTTYFAPSHLPGRRKRLAVFLEHRFWHACRFRKRRTCVCSDISTRSGREISKVGDGKGMVTLYSSKQDRGNVWKRGLGFGRACFSGLGLR
jgi:hypothetical protein